MPRYVVEDIVIQQKVNLIQYFEGPAGKHLIASVLHLLHLVSLAENVCYVSIDFDGCPVLPHVNIEVREGLRVSEGACQVEALSVFSGLLDP